MDKIEKQVFFKVLLPNNIKCLVKTVGENVKVSELKQEVLFDVGFSKESCDDFYLLNITSGQPVTESQCFTCNHRDVIILTKKTNPENLIFSDTSLENIGSSFHQLSAERMDLGDQQKEVLELDGETLDYKKLFYIGQRKYFIKLSKEAREKIIQSRNAVDDIVRKGQKVYGINTGFGKFKDEVIDQDKVKELQENLILSHACGVSKPLTLMATRMVMALRINVLAKGCSGIRLSTLEKILEALNADCLPYIPEKGSVGASGDLAPLSHLAIGLMGYGQMWSPKTGWGDASEILKFNGLLTLDLEAKEGLAINNGTQVIAALGAEALFRADMIAKQADIIAALTTEVLEGVPGQFDKDIHELRPHPGQILTAARLRQLLHASEGPSNGKTSTVSPIIQGRLNREKGIPKTQDPYSIRCTPQVQHGIVHETVAFAKAVLNTEINSATDNPLVLLKRSENKIASAGNFHGEYPGMALDQLAIAIQEIASISERRIERLVHPDYLKDITATGLP